jgi:hypothetical protein
MIAAVEIKSAHEISQILACDCDQMMEPILLEHAGNGARVRDVLERSTTKRYGPEHTKKEVEKKEIIPSRYLFKTKQTSTVFSLSIFLGICTNFE